MVFSVEKIWYGRHFLQWLLRPFSWLYRVGIAIRRFFLEYFCQKNYSVPLIVVGNITVGGVGKTPLVIALAHKMQQNGLRVGIVSRGYGALIKHFPYEVKINDSAFKVGDEPLLLAHKARCPVVIAPKRNQAIDYLLKHHQSQIIISDDGLQHYRMARTVEIAVIDGTRGLGNGLCLPSGPLREPEVRLNQVDLIVMNEGHREGAYSMTMKPAPIKKLSNDEECAPAHLKEEWQAVAAIGNPKRFYSTLLQLGIKFKSSSYPDHYHFVPDDLNYGDSLIIMTEKDAVKCREFCSDLMHYLPVDAVLSDAFWNALSNCLTLKGYANYV